MIASPITHVKRIVVTCILLSISTISYASDNKQISREFFEKPALNLREKCEIFLSWPQGYNDIESRELSQICEEIPVFKAFKSIAIDSHLPINGNLQDETVISMPAKTHGDWPLIDITFKVIMKDGFLEEAIIHSAGSNNNLSQYVAADDWKTNYGHIAIGRLGDAMIVELKNNTITQIAFIPYLCEYDGEKEIGYTVSQVFSWYPPFGELSYSETFYTIPVCT